MPYIPHTNSDLKEMLEEINISSIDELFDEIPQDLLLHKPLYIPDGLTEMDMLKKAQEIAKKNDNGICFIGAGSYDHHIPAAIFDITSRGELITAYTPYQAEASQGTLQILYEFQTMISELTGMEVSNASLYDGATALAEAVLMAYRINPHHQSKKILVLGTIHPFYLKTLKTITCNQEFEIITLPFDIKTGITPLNALHKYDDDPITALIIVQPNFFGCLEEVDSLTNWAHKKEAISIACVNPLSLGLLSAPGTWGGFGVDIVCGDGQPLGCPMNSGGPSFGFLSTHLKYVRQMPGRIVGKTVDSLGNTGFTLTLQAREQHIRRSKATSNICTNQGLLATTATIYMSLLGKTGLQNTAILCHQNTNKLLQELTKISGVEQVFSSSFFHEVLLKINTPVATVLKKLSEQGILGGFSIEEFFKELPNTFLVCATEKRTDAEIKYFANCLKNEV